MSRAAAHARRMFAWIKAMRWLDSQISLALMPHTMPGLPLVSEIDPDKDYLRGVVFKEGVNKILMQHDRKLNLNQSLLEQGGKLFQPVDEVCDFHREEYVLRGIPEGETEEVICRRRYNNVVYRVKSPNVNQQWRIPDTNQNPQQNDQDWEVDPDF